MTGHNIELTYSSKGLFFLFNKEQLGVMEKYTEKRGILGSPTISYSLILDKSPNSLSPNFFTSKRSTVSCIHEGFG